MTRHVLVARQDSVGDVLLAGPAVRAVAAGAGRVTLLCGPRGRGAAELLPGVDEVLVAHAGWIDPEPAPVTRKGVDTLVDRLTELEIDQAVVLTSFHQSPLPLALLLRMAGVPTIAAVSVDYPGALLDVRHRVDEDLHEVERGLSLVATLGYRLPEGDDGSLRVRTTQRVTWPDGHEDAMTEYLFVPGAPNNTLQFSYSYETPGKKLVKPKDRPKFHLAMQRVAERYVANLTKTSDQKAHTQAASR